MNIMDQLPKQMRTCIQCDMSLFSDFVHCDGVCNICRYTNVWIYKRKVVCDHSQTKTIPQSPKQKKDINEDEEPLILPEKN